LPLLQRHGVDEVDEAHGRHHRTACYGGGAGTRRQRKVGGQQPVCRYHQQIDGVADIKASALLVEQAERGNQNRKEAAVTQLREDS